MKILYWFFFPLSYLRFYWIGAAIAAGASILGGMMGNKSSAKQQDDQQEFNAEEAQLNRDWQERMSNTAHQREQWDLRQAGLNPILTATGGMGAATPSGATASSGIASQSNPLEGAVASALAVQRQEQEIANLKAVEEKTKAETIAVAQQGMTSSMDYNLKERQIRQIDAQTDHELKKMGLTEADIVKVRALAELYRNEAKSAGVTARTDQWSESSGLKKIIEASKAAEGATSAVRNLAPLPKSFK